MDKPISYGLIGCGGFGRFCLSHYVNMPGLKCGGVADLDGALTHRVAGEFGVKAWNSPQELLGSAEIDLVHIATPPFTHGSLGLAALRAGKHLLVEKPLAIDMETARALLSESRTQRRILGVNMMMRHSPLCQAVKAIIDSRVLGDPLHAHFINDAKDEMLPPGHWFWNRERSGGIFVEHGVHFFDLFEWWFGPGRILSGQQLARPGSDIIDQVQCSAVFQETVMASFYHGFHQAERRDQQEWLIVFENGTLRMREWVPTVAELDFVAAESIASQVAAFLPGASLTQTAAYHGETAHFTSRHCKRLADGRFLLTTAPVEKPVLYGNMIRSLMEEQLAAIADPATPRLVAGENGISSLAYALEGQRLADENRPLSGSLV